MPIPSPQVYPPTPIAEPQVSPIEESVLENVAESMLGSNDATPRAGTSSESTPTPKQEEKEAEIAPEGASSTIASPGDVAETSTAVSDSLPPPPPPAEETIKLLPPTSETPAQQPLPPTPTPATAPLEETKEPDNAAPSSS